LNEPFPKYSGLVSPNSVLLEALNDDGSRTTLAWKDGVKNQWQLPSIYSSFCWFPPFLKKSEVE